MTTLTRWDPFRDLLSLQARLWDDDDRMGSWAPPVDIVEKGDDLVLRAELAGLDPKDIDIRVEDSTLLLRGERKEDSELREGKTYRRERAYGVFTRRFSLPATVDGSKIGATYTNGVLEVVLPKLDEAKPRQVEIRTS